MATIKLKKPTGGAPAAPAAPHRPPLRGTGARKRPTLAQAQAERAEREAQRPAPAAEPRPRPAGNDRPNPAGRSAPPRPGPGRAAPPRSAQGRKGEPHPASARPAPDRRAPLPPARPAPPRPAAPVAAGTPNTAFSGRPRKVVEPPAEGPAHPDGSLRLSKRMSELGLASRREADEWIAKGWVRVDGEVVAELGARVLPTQQVTIDKRARTQQAQRVTVLLNKPVGYVSGQAEDGYEPAYVLVTPQNRWADDPTDFAFQREHIRHLAPAGRLDIDSVGLLVLTQDGRIAKQLIGEHSMVEKEYLVRVAPLEGERLSAEGLRLLNHGLELDGEALQPARVEWVNDDQLRFVLVEGKKRQIRRMCEAVGLKVTGLKRVRIGRVMLGDLPAGQWRYLGADESFV
ncbi:pseudouridine synthase [Piscinibacter sp.]|jgi:23S rRNA pseudouridine2604 synthase|uniref:pseudouridine synthase n=1 Tax=Piscinibacter sp. TaxID=1903157 RepID=UPI001D8935C2|nr:pseudouridine synthase [Piscinibacter sp.]MBK7533052.1 pseudouridine synthase [Piscinibacter sp.]HPG80793.1 pseudouridine synthase [Piscinibacter sp.]